MRLLRQLGDGGGDLDHDGDIDADDVLGMTHDQAVEIYRRVFWIPGRYSRIHSQAIAIKLFDLVVNMGPRPAHRIAQRACRACGRDLVDDGILGPRSRQAINDVDPLGLVPAMRAEAAGFYRLLVERDPFRSPFLNGWLNRAYS